MDGIVELDTSSLGARSLHPPAADEPEDRFLLVASVTPGTSSSSSWMRDSAKHCIFLPVASCVVLNSTTAADDVGNAAAAAGAKNARAPLDACVEIRVGAQTLIISPYAGLVGSVASTLLGHHNDSSSSSSSHAWQMLQQQHATVLRETQYLKLSLPAAAVTAAASHQQPQSGTAPAMRLNVAAYGPVNLDLK